MSSLYALIHASCDGASGESLTHVSSHLMAAVRLALSDSLRVSDSFSHVLQTAAAAAKHDLATLFRAISPSMGAVIPRSAAREF